MFYKWVTNWRDINETAITERIYVLPCSMICDTHKEIWILHSCEDSPK